MLIKLEHQKWLRNRAVEAAPFVACGIVMRDGSIMEIRNVAENPFDNFSLDFQQINQMIDVKDIAAIWHTHPDGDVTPTQADLEGIKLSGWDYLIVTANEVGLYESKYDTF